MTDPMQGPGPQMQQMGQPPGQAPAVGPPPEAPGQAPGQPQDQGAGQPPPPQDPVQATIQAILSMPSTEAIRRVYQVAASAAKAREQSRQLVDRMDAFGYHALLSASPEVKYASELVAARRELDSLAQERRRLGLEAVKARQSGTQASVARASTYELQAAGADEAMGHVAAGVLMFLSLPSLPQPQDPGQQQPQEPILPDAQDPTMQQQQPGGPI